MAYTSINDVMKRLPNSDVKEQLKGLSIKVQIEFTGKEVGIWGIDVENGQMSLAEGQVKYPNLSISADSEDYLRIVNGELDPIKAYMNGDLWVRGDITKIMHLQSIFRI